MLGLQKDLYQLGRGGHCCMHLHRGAFKRDTMKANRPDEKVGLEAVVDTINSCLDDPIDRSQITTFDIEFLLLKRSAMIGYQFYNKIRSYQHH